MPKEQYRERVTFSAEDRSNVMQSSRRAVQPRADDSLTVALGLLATTAYQVCPTSLI